MTKTISILLFSTLALLTFSCKDSAIEKQKVEYDTLLAEVMRVHDDVMPKTSDLFQIKKQAQSIIELLPEDHEFIKELVNTKVKAEKADEAMMNWMAEFKVPEKPHDEKMDYLNKELKSITNVSELMLTTLKEGKAVIKKSARFVKENNSKS